VVTAARSAEVKMTNRNEFEMLFPPPEDALYNEKRDAYCWANYPNVPHAEYNPQWEAWQAGFSAGVRSCTAR
jgi:hypothetical protein